MSELINGRRLPAHVEVTLQKMRHAVFGFQWQAVNSGDHALVEFANLMQNYLECAEKTAARGEDFVALGIDRSRTIDIDDRDEVYIAEKLSCIYGDRLPKILQRVAEDIPDADQDFC